MVPASIREKLKGGAQGQGSFTLIGDLQLGSQLGSSGRLAPGVRQQIGKTRHHGTATQLRAQRCSPARGAGRPEREAVQGGCQHP